MSLGTQERKKVILRILNLQKRVTVSELEKELEVSGLTIRHDLADLQEKGYLLRVHGGAIIKEKLEYEFPFQERLERNLEEKRAIARAAFSLVREKEAIFLDSGSTVLELAKLLKDSSNLTVVTNSFPVVLELASASGIKLVNIGGEVNPNHFAFCGPSTVRYLQEFYFDKAFVGTDGISVEKGLMTDDLSIAEAERVVIERSKKTIVLADSTKIGATGFACAIKSLQEIDILVTDWKIRKQQLKPLQSEKINVIVAHQK